MSEFLVRFGRGLVLGDVWPIRNHQLIGLATEDLQVSLSREVRKIFKHFVVRIDWGVIDAAVQGDVDGEDYISHLILLPLCASACEELTASRAASPILSPSRTEKSTAGTDDPCSTGAPQPALSAVEGFALRL